MDAPTEPQQGEDPAPLGESSALVDAPLGVPGPMPVVPLSAFGPAGNPEEDELFAPEVMSLAYAEDDLGFDQHDFFGL